MATNAQRKSNHNTLIRTETAISGITREDIATSLDNLSDAIQGIFGTFTDGATITLDMASYHNWKGTIAGNRTIAFSNLSSGDCGIIFVKQDATASRTLTWPGSAVLPTGGLSLSAGANEVTAIGFMYDGTSIFLSKENYGAVAGDTTPPTITSMRVENATPNRIDILYNEALNTGSTPATSAYTVTGKTVSSVVVTGSTVQVTVSVAFGSGDTVSLGYTVPGSNMVKDSAGNNAAAITLSTGNVTNAIGSGEEALSWNQLFQATNVGSGTIQWTGVAPDCGGTATKKLVKTTGNYVQYGIGAATGDSEACVLVLAANNDANYTWNSAGNQAYIGVYHFSGDYKRFVTATNGTTVSLADTPAANDIIRLEVSGDDVIIKKSTNGGVSFSTLSTVTGALTGATNIFIKAIGAVGNANDGLFTCKGLGVVTI